MALLMALEFQTSARVKDGKLRIRNRSVFLEAMAAWPDCEALLTVEKQHATRSKVQNSWYWSQVVGLVSDHTGDTPEDIHEIYKAKFLPKRLAMVGRNGDLCGEFVIGGSTTRLNKIEFSEYCEAIRKWAGDELGVIIPDPDPDYWQKPKPKGRDRVPA